MIYLACPYSHPDPDIRELRFRIACRAAAKMIRDGLVVMSPLSHSHPIALEGGLGLGWEAWRAQNWFMLNATAEVRVLSVAGWRESNGVTWEIETAKALRKPASLWSYREEHGAAGLWDVWLEKIKEL